MLIADRRISLAYRAVAAVVILVGVGRLGGILVPPFSPTAFLFYTMQSNILCLLWLLVLVATTIADLRAHGPRGWSTPAPRVGGTVMMAITVTMLIYLFVLLPQTGPGYEAFTLTDTLVHVASALLLIGDWLLFCPKGRFRWVDPLLWTVLPYAYLVFAFSYGAAGGEFAPGQTFPYHFMDIDRLGLAGVGAWIAVLTVALVGVGYLYVLADRGLGALAGVQASGAERRRVSEPCTPRPPSPHPRRKYRE